MTPAEIEHYLSAAFDSELHVYIQQKTLVKMRDAYSDLGKPKRIYEPQEAAAEIDTFFIMGVVGVIFGLLIGCIHAYMEYAEHGGFGGVILALIALVIYGVLGVLAVGFTIGIIVAICIKKARQHALHTQYVYECQQYEKLCKADANRVALEVHRKRVLQREIQRMEKVLVRSKQQLQAMYGYAVIHPDYQNLAAVGSLYQYFCSGRTQSLGFNALTGDQGAYNIYENERRMDIIITNIEEVLQKFDLVIKYQYELASGLRKAERKIQELCVGVNEFIHNTQRSLQEIEQCQMITAYNSVRMAKELEFMTWMKMFE